MVPDLVESGQGACPLLLRPPGSPSSTFPQSCRSCLPVCLSSQRDRSTCNTGTGLSSCLEYKNQAFRGLFRYLAVDLKVWVPVFIQGPLTGCWAPQQSKRKEGRGRADGRGGKRARRRNEWKEEREEGRKKRRKKGEREGNLYPHFHI